MVDQCEGQYDTMVLGDTGIISLSAFSHLDHPGQISAPPKLYIVL